MTADPLDNINCFCHSCVAPVRYMVEKHPGGISAASPEGGAAFSLFHLQDMELPEPTGEKGTPEEYNLGFLHVGENGKSLRTYTKCCNTQLNMGTGAAFPANFRPLNRNCVYEVVRDEDGSIVTTLKPYTPIPSKIPTNCNLKHAYDDVDIESIPEPKSNGVPMGFFLPMVGRILMYLVGYDKDPKMDAILFIHARPDQVPVETVPITWK
ncbi:MAG: hypothetical protein SGILL_010159 [Bacillariaceae sp.]